MPTHPPTPPPKLPLPREVMTMIVIYALMYVLICLFELLRAVLSFIILIPLTMIDFIVDGLQPLTSLIRYLLEGRRVILLWFISMLLIWVVLIWIPHMIKYGV